MIMLTVTKPRRKLKRLLKGGALLLLLGVVVPGIYYGLNAVGAMSLFASGDNVGQIEQQKQQEQLEQVTPTEQTEQIEQTKQIEQPEQTEQIQQTNLEAAALEESENEPAPPQEEKPGLLEKLRTVIFGEKAEVTPY